MMDSTKYRTGYYPVDKKYNKWVNKDHIEKAPQWCSVDMRDGNQSLVIPMSLEEKLEFYKLLLEVGFKEIEVGFPAASETEYEFLRTLIDNNMIPDDVTVQVLTQCREHIIRKTFDACKGAPSAIIHFYNSVSVAQREQVFGKSKEEIKKIAVDGAKLVKKLASEYEGNFRFEYSPEIVNVAYINRHAHENEIVTEDELFSLLQYGIVGAERTGGKVSLAFGAVSSVWYDEIKKGRGAKPPSQEMLKSAAAHTSLDLLELDEKNKTIKLLSEKMLIDAGAFAKGYAVERVSRMIAQMGVNRGGNIGWRKYKGA